jgi:hypothetical protein
VSTRLTDVRTQRVVEPVLVDADTGERLSRERHVIQAGPAANERMRARMELSRQRRERRRDDASFPN